jgi:two-component SAPR family response regulator
MYEARSNHATVNCLGRFSLDVEGHPVERWRAGRSRSLFQYLLVNKNKVVLKERLREVLWPHAEHAADSSSLKVAVHALRRTLAGPAGIGTEQLQVVYQDFGYLLRVKDSVWIDFAEFEELTAQARAAQARHDLDAAGRAYERAISLYRGDFLLGESADWVDEQREWLRGFVLRALEFLARRALEHGDLNRALDYYRRSLEIDPCREESYREIMLVHGRRGELGQVKRWYELCARRMRELLDTLPAPETDRVLVTSLSGYDDLEDELAAGGSGNWRPADRVSRDRRPATAAGAPAPVRSGRRTPLRPVPGQVAPHDLA